MGIGMLISIFIIICVISAIIGIWISKNKNILIKKHPKLLKRVIMIYIAFLGCCLFPISSGSFPLSFPKAYLFMFSYGTIGMSLVTAYGKNYGKKIYFSVTLLTIIGMTCRYILEYGEASNIYNFTVFNIMFYAVAAPVFTTFVYCRLPKIRQ